LITQSQINHTNEWLEIFANEYHAAVPIRIHSRDIAGDGAPDWSPEMRRWVTKIDSRPRDNSPEPGWVRLKRAMKRLRERSIREYEVLYRSIVMHESIAEITRWLNERSIRGGHPERYTDAHTTIIVYAAVDKIYAWY
jgi:hypothetical protein